MSDRKGSLKNWVPLFFMVMVRQVLMMGRIVSRKKKKEKTRETVVHDETGRIVLKTRRLYPLGFW